jgi:hypothetical protein
LLSNWHELRTPLNAIIGLTEMMVTNAARFGTEKALEPLRRVNAAGTHLLSLINEMAAWSAKVSTNAICLSVKGSTSVFTRTMTPFGIPSRSMGTASTVRDTGPLEDRSRQASETPSPCPTNIFCASSNVLFGVCLGVDDLHWATLE